MGYNNFMLNDNKLFHMVLLLRTRRERTVKIHTRGEKKMFETMISFFIYMTMSIVTLIALVILFRIMGRRYDRDI
jgi:hypothetical protein